MSSKLNLARVLAASQTAGDVPDFVTAQKRLVSMLKRAMGNMKNAKPTQGGVRKHSAGNKAHQGKLYGFHKRATEATSQEDLDKITSELKAARDARKKLRATAAPMLDWKGRPMPGSARGNPRVYRTGRPTGGPTVVKVTKMNYQIVEPFSLDVSNSIKKKVFDLRKNDILVVENTNTRGQYKVYPWDPHNPDPINKYTIDEGQLAEIQSHSHR